LKRVLLDFPNGVIACVAQPRFDTTAGPAAHYTHRAMLLVAQNLQA
jgi:hypothetical protein